jgi:hypothetical protein
MQALSALTPPLLVCAVVIIAIVAFLRHEMGQTRTDRSATGDEGELPPVPGTADADEAQGKPADVARAPADGRGSASRP